MRTFVCLLLLASACASDRGEGEDTLPKRGERANDPTIVSASAHCVALTGVALTLRVRIGASDPGGMTNLGACAATFAGNTVESLFLQPPSCEVDVERSCTSGETFVVEVMATNQTGGFTSASVTLTAE
ncbi:MAG TPA: hypothetical protein VIV11_31990 [Kofleriaceae bacterium]